MKEKITKEILENKWWHRLAKVLIHSASIYIPGYNFDFFYNGYDIIYLRGYLNFFDFAALALQFFILSYILFLFLSLIYYGVILYVVCGIKKIIPFSVISFIPVFWIVFAIFFSITYVTELYS